MHPAEEEGKTRQSVSGLHDRSTRSYRIVVFNGKLGILESFFFCLINFRRIYFEKNLNLKIETLCENEDEFIKVGTNCFPFFLLLFLSFDQHFLMDLS